MELSHWHKKNVYSRAVLKSSCWKQPRELCRLMVYSDIDITQQIQMNSLQVHTTLWMACTNMLSDINQTEELHMYAAISIKVKFIVLWIMKVSGSFWKRKWAEWNRRASGPERPLVHRVKALAVQAWWPKIDPQNPCKKPDVVLHICNLKTQVQWDGRWRRENLLEACRPATLEYSVQRQKWEILL